MKHDSTIDWDMPCAACGYNLRSQSSDSRCPECGQSIRRTLHRDALAYADLVWLRKLRLGTQVVFVAQLALFLECVVLVKRSEFLMSMGSLSAFVVLLLSIGTWL